MLLPKLPNTRHLINNLLVFFELNLNKASCRVTPHLPATSIHEPGSPAENKPANVICAQEAFQAENGHKLHSKVLTIEPNRLLSKCSELNKGAKYRLYLLIVPLLDD